MHDEEYFTHAAVIEWKMFALIKLSNSTFVYERTKMKQSSTTKQMHIVNGIETKLVQHH